MSAVSFNIYRRVCSLYFQPVLWLLGALGHLELQKRQRGAHSLCLSVSASTSYMGSPWLSPPLSLACCSLLCGTGRSEAQACWPCETQNRGNNEFRGTHTGFSAGADRDRCVFAQGHVLWCTIYPMLHRSLFMNAEKFIMWIFIKSNLT